MASGLLLALAAVAAVTARADPATGWPCEWPVVWAKGRVAHAQTKLAQVER
jgi:hypothetical protein